MRFDRGWFHLDRFLQIGQSLIGNILQRQYAAPQQIRPVVIGIQLQRRVQFGHSLRHAINAGVNRAKGKMRVGPAWSFRDRSLKFRRCGFPISRFEQCQPELVMSHTGIGQHFHSLLQMRKSFVVVLQTRVCDSQLHLCNRHSWLLD